MIVLTNEENMIPSVWDDKIKNLVIKMKEQCKTDNSCIWEKETPDLYTEYRIACNQQRLDKLMQSHYRQENDSITNLTNYRFEENLFDSSCPSYKKNIELHAEELRNCTGKNTEAEWEVLHPSLYAEYIKAIRQRDLARTEYIIHMKNISKA